MWADDAQRDRIYDMIGAHSVALHRVRRARAEFERRVLIGAFLLAALVIAGLTLVL